MSNSYLFYLFFFFQRKIDPRSRRAFVSNIVLVFVSTLLQTPLSNIFRINRVTLQYHDSISQFDFIAIYAIIVVAFSESEHVTDLGGHSL